MDLERWQIEVAGRIMRAEDIKMFFGHPPRSVASPRMQAHIPYGTAMRRPDNPPDDLSGPPYQYGMALGTSGVLMLTGELGRRGFISYTSGWEIDPSADTPK
jgi:hypothetical protein